MPTPPESPSPNDRPALEPVRVLRPRRTDALAQLLADIRQDKDYRSHEPASPPLPSTPLDDGTQELPPAPGGETAEFPALTDDSRPPRPADPSRLGTGQRQAAVGIAIVAAAVVGFGCSLFIPSAGDSASSASPAGGAASAPAASAPGAAGTVDILTNPGFESSGLSPWNCAGNPGSIVSSPVHTGSKALVGKVGSRDTAQCDQTVAVRPNTTYALSGWVRGSNVYLGVNDGPSTWTTSPAGYRRLTVTFTTGASQTDATIYVHGWYAQGSYQADDFSLATS